MVNTINYKIVNLRAIAIILVVLGHSIILYANWYIFTPEVERPYLAFIKNSIINPFQLSIFFAVSGYLYASSKKTISFKKFISSKFKRLLVPYFFIGFLWMNPIKYALKIPGFESNISLLKTIAKQILFSGSAPGHLWFLPCLFIIFIIAFITFKYIKDYKGIIIFILLLYIINLFSVKLPSILMINSVLYYLIYFYLGYLLKKTDIKLSCKHHLSNSLLLLSLVILSIYVPFYLKTIFIVFTIIVLFNYIPNKKINILNYISKNSFGIYLFHSPLIYITFKYFTNSNPVYVIFTNFIVFGILSIIITEIIRKTKYKFIIGE